LKKENNKIKKDYRNIIAIEQQNSDENFELEPVQ
jgi:hypothetical protein